MKKLLALSLLYIIMTACTTKNTEPNPEIQKKVEQFAEFKLIANIDDLNKNQKEMLQIIFEVADIMDNLFWEQSYGCKEKALELGDDPATIEFIKLNYGPWERLEGNAAFINGIAEKPPGANFYPTDITKEEFETFDAEDKTSLYTIPLLERKKLNFLANECIFAIISSLLRPF